MLGPGRVSNLRLGLFCSTLLWTREGRIRVTTWAAFAAQARICFQATEEDWGGKAPACVK